MPRNGEAVAFCGVHFFGMIYGRRVFLRHHQIATGRTNLIAPPGPQSQKHDNKPVCAGVWARADGGRHSGSALKRENRQYSLGGKDGIAFIFRPGGLNRTIRPVAIAENMTIKRRTTGFGLKRPGDGMAPSCLEGDFGRIFLPGGGGLDRGRYLRPSGRIRPHRPVADINDTTFNERMRGRGWNGRGNDE